MSSFDVKRASIPGFSPAETEKLLRRQAEDSHLLSISAEKDGKSYGALGELRQALQNRAQLCALSTHEEDLNAYHATLSRIRGAVDEYLRDGAGSADKVGEIVSFISFLNDCGSSREAYDRCWDVGQMIGRKTDVPSEFNRIRLRGLAAAVESHLGRPDRSIVITKDLRESWLKRNVPAGSQRAQHLANFEWWPFATQFETGHPEEAWTELRAIEAKYKRAAEEAVTETDKYFAKRQLKSLSRWLAHIAGSLGKHSEVEEYAMISLAQYERDRLEEVDAGRSTAYCELIWAESVYVQGKHERALELLQNALARNKAGTKSFQKSFLRLQCQLSIVSAEIRAFGAGGLPMVTCGEIDSSVKELAVCWEDILMEHTSEFYFTNRVLGATYLAIAAASIAKIGDSSDRALHLANHVLGDWLSFGQGVERDSENAWVSELAVLPRALASAVAAKCTRSETSRDHAQQATAFVKSLSGSKKERYRRIFEFCEIQLRDGPALSE
jgi:hypothetical protein